MASVTTISNLNSAFIDFGVVQVGGVPVPNSGDIQSNPVGERINSAMWSSGDTTLTDSEMHTSSVQYTASGEYYLDVYRADPIADPTQVPQFSVAFGDFDGKGESSLEGQTSGLTPTKAIYSQYAALLEDKSTSDTDFKFDISGSTDSIYVVNIGRNQLKERADSGNWELKISGSSVHTFVDSLVGSGSNDLGDGPIDIVSGSLDGVAGAPGFTSYGKFYPNHGVMVFNAANVDATTGTARPDLQYHYGTYSAPYTASQVMLKTGALGLFNAIKGGAHFQARNTEHLHSKTYFCRIPSYAANHSSNPTYTTGSTGTFRHTSMVGNPKTYITTVGLYDENNDLLAVAKLSKPLLKSFNREALVRVRLEY
jgi:hypothetical protein